MLRRIEAERFLSFGQRIMFNVDPGLTVVTGPNGAGKSNLGRCLKLGRAVIGQAGNDPARDRTVIYAFAFSYSQPLPHRRSPPRYAFPDVTVQTPPPKVHANKTTHDRRHPRRQSQGCHMLLGKLQCAWFVPVEPVSLCRCRDRGRLCPCPGRAAGPWPGGHCPGCCKPRRTCSPSCEPPSVPRRSKSPNGGPHSSPGRRFLRARCRPADGAVPRR
jgi:hypothetical protein